MLSGSIGCSSGLGGGRAFCGAGCMVITQVSAGACRVRDERWFGGGCGARRGMSRHFPIHRHISVEFGERSGGSVLM